MTFYNLFVYGSLLDADTRERVIGRKMPYSEPDSLSGFKCEEITIDGEYYPALCREVNSSVHGAIVIIHENELRFLDEYETDAYRREMVVLMSGKEAWTFVKR